MAAAAGADEPQPGFLVDPFLGKGNLRLGKDRIKTAYIKNSHKKWVGPQLPDFFLPAQEMGVHIRPSQISSDSFDTLF